MSVREATIGFFRTDLDICALLPTQSETYADGLKPLSQTHLISPRAQSY